MEQVTSLLKNIDDLQRELKTKDQVIFNMDLELSVKQNDVRILQAKYKEIEDELKRNENEYKAVVAALEQKLQAIEMLAEVHTVLGPRSKTIDTVTTAPVVDTSRALNSNTTTGNAGSAAVTSLTARTTTPAYDTATNGSSHNINYGLKVPKYKSPGDIETFINRFEQFCSIYNIEEAKKANLILCALDDASFTVTNRELKEEEKKDYNTIKNHLLKRFGIYQNLGQRRLLFRQTKREVSQSFEEFYTHLLGLAAKAFPGESADSIDKNILDQFLIGSRDDKVRLYLIEKNPKTSREALSMAVAYKAVLQYNETLKENMLVAAASIGEEKNESSRRKLQNNTDESKEHERSKERSTSSEKYSTRINETEDRKYHSNRNNKRQERDDDSRRNSFNRNNQHKDYDARINFEKMNNDFC